jgi:hypothetical protein
VPIFATPAAVGLCYLCCCCIWSCSEYSKTLNDARLKVLAARETAIQTVVKEARSRVRDLARNPTAYKKLLQDLLVQVRAAACGWRPGGR